jgi:AcrR family transcriptional regulator
MNVAVGGGLAQVSMRNVGKALGVEAMSLYHHIPGKEPLLDALIESVFEQIETPSAGMPWRAAMVARTRSARQILGAHPWAIGLIESRRTPLPCLLRHHEGVLACLRADGFSIDLAAHAFSALDAYVFGFVLTEANLPTQPEETIESFVIGIQALIPPETYPRMTEIIRHKVLGKNYSYGDEFHFGLDLILDSLEWHLAAEPGADGP